LLLVTTISLQYKSIFDAYTVRFWPVWNPVMEGMTTICTLPTVHTNFIYSISNLDINVILKNTVKIIDNAKNNYYDTQLSDIHFPPSLCYVKRYTIYKGKKRNVNSPFLTSTSESQVDSL
jgi:hypothetical protein